MKEVRRALCNASADDSKLLLLSAVGSVFCSGLDYSYLIGRLSNDRRKESTRIAEAIRDFVKAFIQFKKPIVVAINGPALGLGASILPLCDIVWASEKAWFQTPYATIRLTPAGCSSYTFPQILGVALANEMLFCGRKLTAQEACSRGLVSQVFWPTTFSQEVMLRVKEMASCSAVVLEESKCLMRSFLKSGLEDVNEKECQMLKQLWSSSKGLDSLFSYLQDKIYEVWCFDLTWSKIAPVVTRVRHDRVWEAEAMHQWGICDNDPNACGCVDFLVSCTAACSWFDFV